MSPNFLIPDKKIKYKKIIISVIRRHYLVIVLFQFWCRFKKKKKNATPVYVFFGDIWIFFCFLFPLGEGGVIRNELGMGGYVVPILRFVATLQSLKTLVDLPKDERHVEQLIPKRPWPTSCRGTLTGTFKTLTLSLLKSVSYGCNSVPKEPCRQVTPNRNIHFLQPGLSSTAMQTG